MNQKEFIKLNQEIHAGISGIGADNCYLKRNTDGSFYLDLGQKNLSNTQQLYLVQNLMFEKRDGGVCSILACAKINAEKISITHPWLRRLLTVNHSFVERRPRLLEQDRKNALKAKFMPSFFAFIIVSPFIVLLIIGAIFCPLLVACIGILYGSIAIAAYFFVLFREAWCDSLINQALDWWFAPALLSTEYYAKQDLGLNGQQQQPLGYMMGQDGCYEALLEPHKKYDDWYWIKMKSTSDNQIEYTGFFVFCESICGETLRMEVEYIKPLTEESGKGIRKSTGNKLLYSFAEDKFSFQLGGVNYPISDSNDETKLQYNTQVFHRSQTQEKPCFKVNSNKSNITYIPLSPSQ